MPFMVHVTGVLKAPQQAFSKHDFSFRFRGENGGEKEREKRENSPPEETDVNDRKKKSRFHGDEEISSTFNLCAV